MFKKCLINQAIIEGSLRGKTLLVIQRYLRKCYGIKVSINTLKKRKGRLYLSGKIKKTAISIFNNSWATTYNFKGK